jgi:hypothetical protein
MQKIVIIEASSNTQIQDNYLTNKMKSLKHIPLITAAPFSCDKPLSSSSLKR